MPDPATEVVVIGRFDERPGYATRRTGGASSWLVLWTDHGAGRIEQGGAVVRAEPGDLVVLGSGVGHDYRVAPDAGRWAFWWAHFQPRPAWPALLSRYAMGGKLYAMPGLDRGVHHRVDQVFRRSHADARWSGHGRPPVAARPGIRVATPAVATTPPARELVRTGIEEILLLATATARDPDSGGVDPRVREVEALMAADPAAPHTVRSLAGSVALSPSRFAHLFAEQTGRTPMQALREARLGHGARLLEVTDLDVGQVAAASGFASPFHFSRSFRQLFGVPPRQYRQRFRSAPPNAR
jgi:AraC family transcriptional regulator of arabinose operon